MLIQGFLARKKTGMEIGASGILDFHSALNGIKVLGKVIPVRLVGLALELDDAYVHSCAAVLRGSLQLLQKLKRILHYLCVCGRRAVQYENDFALEFFLRTWK